MIAPLPLDGWPQKPGSATFPFFGVQPVLITPEGKEIEGPGEGLLAIKGPWPSTIRGTALDAGDGDARRARGVDLRGELARVARLPRGPLARRRQHVLLQQEA